MGKYRKFLEKIGYLVPVPAKVKVTTKNVDAELALQAGPQLVVPITNARYALNAANARWGSLYDALYGTDALPEDGGAEKGTGYNPVRGAKVIEYARHVLDRCAPLAKGSHLDSTAYRVVDNNLAVTLKDGSTSGLKNPAQFVGFQGEMGEPSAGAAVAPRPAHGHPHRPQHGDRQDRPRRRGRPGARSRAVDHPRPRGLGGRGRRRRQGAGLPQLAGHPEGHADRRGLKGGSTFTRGLNPDRQYTGPRGEDVSLHGRSLLFVRNVGHLMTTPRCCGARRPGDPGRHPRRAGHHQPRCTT
jgi:malate synthase